MSSVYIVYENDYECSPMIGIYSNKENADRVCQWYTDNYPKVSGFSLYSYWVVERTLDDFSALEGNLWFSIAVTYFPQSNELDVQRIERETEKREYFHAKITDYADFQRFYLSLPAISLEAASQKARDRVWDYLVHYIEE